VLSTYKHVATDDCGLLSTILHNIVEMAIDNLPEVSTGIWSHLQEIPYHWRCTSLLVLVTIFGNVALCIRLMLITFQKWPLLRVRRFYSGTLSTQNIVQEMCYRSVAEISN